MQKLSKRGGEISSPSPLNTLDAAHLFLNPCLQRQIVYACVSPKAKLFSLQLNNQSKIPFRRFLPFELSFQLCSGPEGVHWDL